MDSRNKFKYSKGDLVFAFFIILLSIAIIIESMRIKIPSRASILTAPALLPFVLGIILLFLAIYIEKKCLLDQNKLFTINKLKRNFFNKFDIKKLNKVYQKSFIVIFLVIIYTFLLGNVSYHISTFLFLFLFMAIMKAGSLLKIFIITSIGTAFISYLLLILQIPLP